jgi:methionine-rich copper-binding protein CopC
MTMKTKIAFLSFALAFPLLASAHAFLDHADPKVGSTDNDPPKKVTLTFTQAVEPAFSTIVVTDASGNSVDKSDAKVDPDDGTKMTISLKDLPPGTYKVEWKVTSVDTHRTHGSFTFDVKAKA